MNDDFDKESEKFEREVRECAAGLVRRGTPPFDAIEEARRQVSAARRAQSARNINDLLSGQPKS